MADSTPTNDNRELPAVPTFEPEAAPELQKPKYMVVGSTFIAQTEQGEVRLPMQFKTRQFRLMPIDLEPIGQIFHLMADEKKTLEQLDELDFQDSVEIADKFIQAYTERQQVRRLGESRSSSRS